MRKAGVVVAVLLSACSEDEEGAKGTCPARALVAFYSDAACTAMVGMRSYDTGQECFSWTAPGTSAMENSAGNRRRPHLLA
jgi:hypothetical protein